jgi:hypothetical protein
LRGRALIGCLGEEIPRHLAKLQMCNHRRFRVVRASGVSLMSERETTPPCVKVPKYQLSVIERRVFMTSDNQEVGLEAAIL